MSLIQNLIKETEKKPSKGKKDKDGDEGESEDKPLRFVKTATDLQRLKLEKLMKNPEKPVVIPEARREKDYMASVPTFVRNVMGSSAGAGSGEFHVYRHLRRKEYARQKNIQAHSAREEADLAYQEKLDNNKRIAEERTAKKRAKRQKKKQRAKQPREQKSSAADKTASESNDSDTDEERAATVESTKLPEDEVQKKTASQKDSNVGEDQTKNVESTEQKQLPETEEQQATTAPKSTPQENTAPMPVNEELPEAELQKATASQKDSNSDEHQTKNLESIEQKQLPQTEEQQATKAQMMMNTTADDDEQTAEPKLTMAEPLTET